MKEFTVNNITVTPKGIVWNPEPINNQLVKADAKEMLTRIKRVLDEYNIKFYLTFGTLLGAVRENDFIGHDYDIDIDIFWYDLEKFYKAIPALHENGINFFRYHENTIFSFEYKGIVCDIDVVFKPWLPYNLRYYKTLGKLFPKKYVKETETLNFGGSDFQVPKHPEYFLEYMYGKEWRIPVKGKHARLFPKWMVLEKFAYKVREKINFIKRTQLTKNS